MVIEMKKLDWIIISSISIIAIILTIILVSDKKIDADSVDISVVFKSEEIYKLSIDDEGLYYISVKDNHLTLTKNELILFEKDVDNKDFTVNIYKILVNPNLSRTEIKEEFVNEVLKNIYSKAHSDDSNIIVNGVEFSIDTTNYQNPANIVKCSVLIDGVSYYATMPVIVSRIKDDNYKVKLLFDTGYKTVMYTTDGQNPAYDNLRPFTLEVLRKIDGL